MSTTENMKLFLKERGIPITRFVSEIGMSVGYLYSTTDFSCEVIRKIIRMFPELNIYWLLTGEGEMTRNDKQKDFELTVKIRRKGDTITVSKK